ncbi:MAG: hypothetical protein R6U89_07170 [Dehalococcoidia bacterium]
MISICLTHRTPTLLAIVGIGLVAALVTAFIVMNGNQSEANRGDDVKSFVSDLQSTAEDSQIVARVDGQPVSKGAIRIQTVLGLRYGTADLSSPLEIKQLSRYEAEVLAARRAMQSAAMMAEVERRNIEVSLEEAQARNEGDRAMIERMKNMDPEDLTIDAWEGLQVLEARIELSGLTEDEWWEDRVEYCRQLLYITKLKTQVLSDLPAEAGQFERMQAWEDFQENLLAEADIEILDEAMEPLIQEVLTRIKN